MKKIYISIKRWFLLVFLLLLFCSLYYLDIYRYLTFDTIKAYQFTAQQWTLTHHKITVSVYLATFIVLVACAIPCGTILTLLGGFLFGTIAILYAEIGTTIGGSILFLAVRMAIGEHLTARPMGWIKSMEQGFKKNAFNYLVMLRLIPIFPCGIINVAAGALNVPLKTYLLASFIGILPATIIYVLIGRGLDKFLTEKSPNFSMIWTPSIFFPLLGLVILSILPIIYKHVKKRQKPLE